MTDTADAAQDDGSPAWRVTLWAMIAVQVIMSLSFTFLSPVRAGRVVARKAGLAHAAAVIDDQSLNVFFHSPSKIKSEKKK